MLKKLSKKLIKSFKLFKKAQAKTKGLKKFKNFFGKMALPLFIVTIGLILAVQNYSPGTFLSGWDTLHPEFDYKLNLARTLSGVFRTEQGLGAVASHAHMVEITRILMLWIYDIFLPQNLLRYAYFFTCLIVGPLGMFYFLKNVFFKRQFPSFLGALFYLLNLGTYQIFVVPFEMFAALYATIPWFFLTFDSLLRRVDRKNIALFSLVVLLTSQAAYASSLWYLFFGASLLYFLPFVILKIGVEGIFKRFLIAIGLILIINSYWILPNIYFALNDAKYVTSANINKLFSDEAFLKNKEFGNVEDILRLKSFYFDWGIYNFSTERFEQITLSFQNHLSNGINSNLALFYAATFVFGFFLAIKRYKALSLSFIMVVSFSLIFLFNNNPPLSFVFNLLQEHLPLFKEALRFPHNKIHNVFIFFVSLFFAVGIDFFIIHLRKISKANYIPALLVLFVSASLIYYMLPAFQGNLINNHMKSRLPNEYFEVFDYLKKEGDGRVANLPVHSPWGWVYNKWDNSSFQGAGFLYFGIKQSLLDRDFDRWNPLNEQYYLEISNAIYSEDEKRLQEVIDKYDITHLLLDESVVNPGGEVSSLYFNATKYILDKLLLTPNNFVTKKSFGNYLTIYKFEQKDEFPITALEEVTLAHSYSNNYYTDYIYNNFGDYVEFEDKSFIKPFSFVNNESKVNKNILKIEEAYATLNVPDNSKTSFDISTIPDLINSRIIGSRNSQGQLLLDIYPSFAKLDGAEIISPIHNEVLLEDSSILTVNENVIYLDKVDSIPTILDNALLSPTSNIVATFDRDPDSALTYYFPSIPMSFSYCGDENGSNILSVVSENSLTVEGELVNDYCVRIPGGIFSTYTSTTLSRITFEYPNSNGISACLKRNNEDKCYYNIPVKNIGQYKTLEFAVTQNRSANSMVEIRIGKGSEPIVELNYINVELFPSVNEVLIDNNYFQNEAPKSFTKVSLPYSKDNSTYSEANSKTSLDNECADENSIGNKSLVEGENPYFEYSSKTGSFCDHFEFASLSHAQSYFVIVKSQNSKGLPMTICITNYSSRKCDVFSKLSTFEKPDTDIFFLPSTDSGLGYDVNIENRSVNKSPSLNRLYSVQFIPVQDSLVNSILSGKSGSRLYEGKIERIGKLTDTSFFVDVENKPTLIKLSYAYQDGFKAYKVSCKNDLECKIASVLAPVNGTQLNQGKGSSWNNVWEYIPSGDSNEKVVITFVPQILQYAGLGMLSIPLLYLFLPALQYLLSPVFLLDSYFRKRSDFFREKIKARLDGRISDVSKAPSI